MATNKHLLINVRPSSLNSITFGDDAKGSNLGLGSLNIPGLSKLRDVPLVGGLKANLISINQLCDQDLFVKFTNDRCVVLDRN